MGPSLKATIASSIAQRLSGYTTDVIDACFILIAKIMETAALPTELLEAIYKLQSHPNRRIQEKAVKVLTLHETNEVDMFH